MCITLETRFLESGSLENVVIQCGLAMQWMFTANFATKILLIRGRNDNNMYVNTLVTFKAILIYRVLNYFRRSAVGCIELDVYAHTCRI